MGAARRLKTFDELYAEIEALPEGLTGEILEPGVLRTMARPATRHRASGGRLYHRLLGEVHVDGGGTWWIDWEVEIALPDGRLYVPDLAGWRLSEDDDLSFLDCNPVRRIPDWVCEILSRGTQRGDRALKLPHYAAAGVTHVWVLDPDAVALEVYEATARGPLLVASVAGADSRAIPPFDLPICPEELFSVKRPPRSRARRRRSKS